MTDANAQGGTEDFDGPLYAPSKKVYPQSVKGRFRNIKTGLLVFCLAVYYLLPFVRWSRGPNLPDQAVLVDFERRRLYFFFIELWPQEVYYLTGLLIIAAIALFLMNAVAGRLWCGYLCPQTVWTDLFLKVERLIEGDRRERIKRDEGTWTAAVWSRKALKHFVWIMIAWWTGGAWVLYFSDAPTLVRDLATFQAPWAAYIWIAILTFTTYALAGHMREQVCLYMCPWPRIQAALTDADALNVTYRYDRGEPRVSFKQAQKLKAAGQPAGDCVDCNQCVAVCPTGVDIREGTQLGCIQCGLCIDACDDVMGKLGRSAGLIGYDMDEAVKARVACQTPRAPRFVRPRTILYAAIIAFVGGAMVYQLATRKLLEMSVVHERTPLFTTLRDGSIRNAYTLRIANKRSEERLVAITVEAPVGSEIEVVGGTPSSDWRPIVTLAADTTTEVKLLISMPRSQAKGPSQLIHINASDISFGEVAKVRENFFAP
ncbi:MAG: cytochrome c oxidase accessory protein CcoG [Beijerinckiaceae bacterium]